MARLQSEPTLDKGLTGKVALVTGASRGLGRDAALALARAGADVACCATREENAREVVAEIRALGRRALALGGRVQDSADVEHLFTRTEAELGTVEILINNAGISRPKPILEMDDATFDEVMAINMRGVFVCARRAARALVAAGMGGAIVNVGSIAGMNAFPNRSNYCASKAAVHHLTRVMAIEWAEHGIRVNCIAPGYIRTPLLDDLIAQGIVDEAALNGRVPQRRLGASGDISAAVLYLVGAGAGYVTGTVLTVDGGWDAYGFI